MSRSLARFRSPAPSTCFRNSESGTEKLTRTACCCCGALTVETKGRAGCRGRLPLPRMSAAHRFCVRRERVFRGECGACIRSEPDLRTRQRLGQAACVSLLPNLRFDGMVGNRTASRQNRDCHGRVREFGLSGTRALGFRTLALPMGQIGARHSSLYRRPRRRFDRRTCGQHFRIMTVRSQMELRRARGRRLARFQDGRHGRLPISR